MQAMPARPEWGELESIAARRFKKFSKFSKLNFSLSGDTFQFVWGHVVAANSQEIIVKYVSSRILSVESSDIEEEEWPKLISKCATEITTFEILFPLLSITTSFESCETRILTYFELHLLFGTMQLSDRMHSLRSIYTIWLMTWERYFFLFQFGSKCMCANPANMMNCWRIGQTSIPCELFIFFVHL